MTLPSAITASFLLLLFAIFRMPNLCNGWGADPVPDSKRPSRAFLESFPTTPTIYVTDGGSIGSALWGCNGKVGKSGYCTIGVTGTPKKEEVYLWRSYTKVVGLGPIGNATLSGSGKMNFIEIQRNVKEVVIENLEFIGHRAENEVNAIVFWGGNITKVAILKNLIHDFDANNGNAQGIAVLGVESEPIKEVIIEDNEIRDMKNGKSENIAVNGNVERFEIKNNYVHNINNIGIDAIGGEGTREPTTVNGRVLPHPDDVARFGFIESNVVKSLSTKTNPAYNNEEKWAAAIYTDGSKHILLADNKVENSSWGYSLGAENCVISKHVTAVRNEAKGSFFGDMVIGAYAEGGYLDDPSIECDPRKTADEDEGHGYVQYITVKNNRLLSNDSKYGKLLIQKRVTHAIIEEPGVEPQNSEGDGSATGDENAIRTSET